MINMNSMVDSLKSEENSEGGLSDLMGMAKDFNAEDIERYKNMSKMELLDEIKNSEHSDKVIAFLKELVARK